MDAPNIAGIIKLNVRYIKVFLKMIPPACKNCFGSTNGTNSQAIIGYLTFFLSKLNTKAHL